MSRCARVAARAHFVANHYEYCILPNAMDRGGRLNLFRTFVFRICI